MTIATNMAGRGTDIVLGGNLQAELVRLEDLDESERALLEREWRERHRRVVDSGGLHIVGTERHESRRVDNQLRGRSGRQGDPGSTRFYLSLEDDLMRIFASERVATIMQKLGMERGEAIEHKWVTKAIENAQRKVEARNFDIRKQLLEYDDVANDQRKEVYALRTELQETEDISARIEAIRHDVIEEIVDQHIPPQSLDEQWNVPGLETALRSELGLQLPVRQWLDSDDELHEEPLRRRILEEAVAAYREKETRLAQAYGPEVAAGLMRRFEKEAMLAILDTAWKEHLAAMDYLRQGIHLRGYAQKNPKQEYKREAFEMFQGLTHRLKTELIGVLSKVQLRDETQVEAMEARNQRVSPASAVREEPETAPAPLAAAPGRGIGQAARPRRGNGAAPTPASRESTSSRSQAGPPRRGNGTAPAPAPAAGGTPFVRAARKVGRNEPCPCGSGKKYKRCCGRLA